MSRHQGMMLRATLLGSCAFAAIFMQSPARAADAATNDQSVSELVVTAQKREERLQDVPVSVSVVGAAQLDRQNITTITDLSRAVPSLGSNGGIRGVATNGVARSSESSVSVVLDGVVLGRAVITDLFDLDRVEVLSGPQGTLFGKNASAGVINIVTKAPDPSKFEVIGHADVGNLELQRERITLNAPLSSDAAIRVGLHHDEQGGWITDTLTGQKNENETWGGRARLLWEPSSNLRINLIGDYEKTTGTGVPPEGFAIAPTAVLQASLASCGVTASLTNTRNCADGVSARTARAEDYGLSAQIDYTLPHDFVLTSITANRWANTGDFGYKGLGGDSDLLSADILSTNLVPHDVKTFSQELRIASPAGGRLEGVAGLYFSDTKTLDQIIQGGTLGLVPPPLRLGRINIIHVYERSYAAFGQATFHVTDHLSLIAGARYTDETVKDVSTSLTDMTTPTVASYGFIYNPGFFLAPVNARAKTDNFSWRLGAQYEWSKDVMAYVTATRGYKGPAINDQASPPLVHPIIVPEIPMYYEAGVKATLFDGRMLATAAYFHNRVENFQTSVFAPPTATNPVANFAQGNAPFITSQGLDVEVFGRPIENLTLNAGVIYDDAQYASSFVVACNPEQVKGTGACSTLGTTQAVPQIAGAPKWKFLLNGEYDHNLSSSLVGYIQSDLSFTSKIYAAATPNPRTDIPAETLWGARLGVRSEDGRWGVSIFGRNLLDKRYVPLTGDPLSGFDGGGGGAYWALPSFDSYRTYGITLDTRF